MAANPITFVEIESYRRQTFANLTAWEVGLIRRIDNAILSVVAGNAPKPKTKDAPEPEAIPVSDISRVKALFRGFKKKPKPPA